MSWQEIDPEVLISLVRSRPSIWDKTNASYRERTSTRSAWREICGELKNDFEWLDETEKDAFGKEVIKKWANIRDAFHRACKKQEQANRLGLGGSSCHKYIFHEQLQFLNKIYEGREPTDNLVSEQEEDADNSFDIPETESWESKVNVRSRKRRIGPLELEPIVTLQQTPDRHTSFFSSIIPSLMTFDDDEIIEFQTAVLQAITSIKRQKRGRRMENITGQSLNQIQPTPQPSTPDN